MCFISLLQGCVPVDRLLGSFILGETKVKFTGGKRSAEGIIIIIVLSLGEGTVTSVKIQCLVAGPVGFEPTISGFGGRRVIHSATGP